MAGMQYLRSLIIRFLRRMTPMFLLPLYLGRFKHDCKKFNEIYKLSANNNNLKFLGTARLQYFKEILKEEFDEVNEILDKAAKATTYEEQLAVMVELADWLADMVVYEMTEAGRWGIPMDRVLHTIMSSNFSKLGADGKPIYDARGKVMKGPGYWKPEPKILEEFRKMKMEDLSGTSNIVFS